MQNNIKVNTNHDSFDEEAKKLYKDTNEYKEYIKRNKTKQELEESSKKLMEIFKEFGQIKLNNDKLAKLNKVKELKDFITNNYYTCTDQVLYGLSNLYICDERFKNNIDKTGGEGTALFVSDAIKEYLNSK